MDKSGVRWSTEEWETIAEYVAKVHKSETDSGQPKTPLTELVAQAQEILLDKPRRKTHIAMTGSFYTKWKPAYARAKELAVLSPMPKAQPMKQEEYDLAPTQGIDDMVVEPEPIPQQKLSIVDLLAKRLGDSLKQAVKEALEDPEIIRSFQHTLLDALTTPTIAVPEQTKVEPKPKVKKIPKARMLVCGLIGVQAESVRKEIGEEEVELRFFGTETPSKRLVEQASGSDYVFVMTKFISHQTEDAVRKGCGDETEFIRVNGGPTDLIRSITARVHDWRVRVKQ